NIAADGPAALLESIPKPCGAELTFRIILGVEHQHADAPHAVALLRPPRERPRGRAAEQCDELASPHSITLSARTTSAPGTSWPIPFAVLRLMASSNLVGCSTGRSPGCAPRKSLASCRLMASRHKGTISGP